MHTVVVYKVTLVHDNDYIFISVASYLEIESAARKLLNVSKFVRPGVVALIGKKNCVVVLDFNLWHFNAATGS